jgi:hypothetical protein
MNYTPFGTLTDNELIREVCNKSDPTDLELELMERLTYWMEYAATVEAEVGYHAPRSKVETKYVDA